MTQTGTETDRFERLRAPFVLAMMALAACLRLISPERDFWADEVAQWQMSVTTTPTAVIRNVQAGDRFPPLYALLVFGSTKLGQSEFFARLPSLVSGLLLIPAFWALGRVWVGPRVGAILALFATICPAYVYYSTECRPYALGLLFTVLTLWACRTFGDQPSWSRVARLSLLLFGCAVSQYSAIVVAGVGLATAFAERVRSDGTRFLISSKAVTVVAAYVVATTGAAVFMRPQITAQGTGTTDFLSSYFFNPADVFGGLAFAARGVAGLAQFVTAFGLSGPRWSIAVACVWLPALAALLPTRRIGGVQWRVASVALGGLAAFIVMAGLGLHPFGGIRHCLPLTPGLFLLLAMGIERLSSNRLGRTAGQAAILAMTVLMLIADWRVVPARHRNETQAAISGAPVRPNDRVLVVAQHACTVFAHYLPHHPLATEDVRYLPGSGAYREAVDPAIVPANVREAASGAPRVWLFELPTSSADPGIGLSSLGYHVEHDLSRPGIRFRCWSRQVP